MTDDCLVFNRFDCGLIMSDRKVNKILVKNCFNPVLWYKQHVGEQFDVVWFDPEEAVFWVQEKDELFKARNWIACKDAEVIQ